jgi:hypothetical protein
MYATAPVAISLVAPYALLLAALPPLWFLAANTLLHAKFLAPRTM